MRNPIVADQAGFGLRLHRAFARFAARLALRAAEVLVALEPFDAAVSSLVDRAVTLAELGDL